MRRNVAGTARIVVVAPGPADVVAALQNDKIVDPGLRELDTHADAGKPGTDDRYVAYGLIAALALRIAHADIMVVTDPKIESLEPDTRFPRSLAAIVRRPRRD